MTYLIPQDNLSSHSYSSLNLQMVKGSVAIFGAIVFFLWTFVARNIELAEIGHPPNGESRQNGTQTQVVRSAVRFALSAVKNPWYKMGFAKYQIAASQHACPHHGCLYQSIFSRYNAGSTLTCITDQTRGFKYRHIRQIL
jgi:hypothetical protein